MGCRGFTVALIPSIFSTNYYAVLSEDGHGGGTSQRRVQQAGAGWSWYIDALQRLPELFSPFTNP